MNAASSYRKWAQLAFDKSRSCSPELLSSLVKYFANHGSICDSRPIAISGHARGPIVPLDPQGIISELETLPRPARAIVDLLRAQLFVKAHLPERGDNRSFNVIQQP